MGGVTESLLSRSLALLPSWVPLSPALLLLYLLLPLLLVAVAAWYLSEDQVLLRKMPGPKPVYPILGSLPKFPGNIYDILDALRAFSAEFPGFFRAQLWHNYAIINSPDAVESLLSSTKHIEKGEEYNGLLPWLSTGLLTSAGSKWAKRRKMLTPAFHFNILDQFVDIFNEQAGVLVSKLDESKGDKIDIFPYITKATLDIICEATMGVKIGAQHGARSDYVEAVHKMGKVAFLRFLKPWLKSEFIFRWTSLYRDQVECLKLLHGFTDSVIKARREELNSISGGNAEALLKSTEGKRVRLAFLDLLLTATIDGKPLTNADIREEVDTFMFEGHDTTSAGANWTIYNLGQYPEVQERAYQEVVHVLGEDDSPISRDQLSQLYYVEQVVKESIRLFPPVPMIGRRLASDAVICGYKVPRSCFVGILIYCIHRDPKHWPDPEKFDPDRFSVEASRGRHPYSFVPFSAGPRNCIGQKFAMMEEKVLIAQVLRRFKIKSYQSPDELRIRGDVILRAEGGLWLSFTRR